MITETLMLIGFFGILAIMIYKVYRITQNDKITEKSNAVITLLIGSLFWVMVLIGFITSIGYQNNAKIVNGSSTITVSQSDNSYEIGVLLMKIVNSFFFLTIGLTVAEIIFTFKNDQVKRFMPNKT